VDSVQQLLAHTPIEHVEYTALKSLVKQLEQLDKMIHEGVSSASNISQMLDIERKIIGGCPPLLDKEQVLVREGLNNDYMIIMLPLSLNPTRCSQVNGYQ